MGSVLLTNGLLRKSLAAARSLGSRGIEVTVGETSRFHPAGYSKFTKHSLVYPDPVREPEAHADWLERTLSGGRYDALLPMDDGPLDLVMRERERFGRLTRLALPPSEAYWRAADKGESVRLAEAAGAKVPQTWTPRSMAEVRDTAEAWSDRGPIVVKPRRGSGSRGIQAVQDAGELVRVYEAIHTEHPWPILQQYIEAGDRYDICLLYDNDSQVKARFAQKELRHYPIPRGPSTAQESVHVPELMEIAEAIMKPLGWVGIVELEFMVDPRDGLPYYMEINTRFWNSLHLAVMCGVDFPWMLYRLAVEGKVEQAGSYPAGVRCRNLLPGDLLHFAANPQRFRMNPPLLGGRKRCGEDDVISRKDPMAAAGFAMMCLRQAWSPAMWRMLLRRT